MRYFLLLLIILGLIFFPLKMTQGGSLNVELKNPLQYNSIAQLTDALINAIFTLALYITPIVIIIAGFYFITSGGNPAKVQLAQNAILYASIGFIVILLAKGILALIKMALGVNP